MAREANIWTALRKAHFPGVWERVENRVGVGTPDVSYAIPGAGSGWIELKHRARWPVRKGGLVTLPLITRAQRIWHLRWAQVGGGSSWWLVRVAREDLLFDGVWGATHLGRINEATMREAAVCVGLPGLPEALRVGVARMFPEE